MDNVNKIALVTGASAGIGEAYCQLLAKDGCSLVVVARSADKLASLAKTLEHQYKIKVFVCVQDLAEPNAAANIYNFTQQNNLAVDLLINNAGFGDVGHFLDHSMEEHSAMLRAMLGAIVELTHFYLPSMLGKKHGGIINVSSVVGLLGLSLRSQVTRALYRPIKCFVIAFTEQLALAYKDTGVHFQCLCPGLTISEFHKRSGQAGLRDKTPKFLWLSSEEVATRSYFALRKNRKVIVVTGFINKIGIFIHRLVNLFSI